MALQGVLSDVRRAAASLIGDQRLSDSDSLRGGRYTYIAFVTAVLVAGIYARRHQRQRKDERPRGDIETNGRSRDVNRNRAEGEWTPEQFRYPEVTPMPYELQDIKPVPYRPFRWGEYHITMGIRSMPWSEWIEIDKEYAAYHRARKFRLQTRGREVVRVLDDRTEGVQIRGGAEAAKELVYEIAEYLSRRYPSTFSVTRYAQSEKATTSPPSVGGLPLAWDGLSPIKTITIVPLGETYDLSVLESMSGTDMGEEAMRICAMLVQEDLAIMIEGDDGQYYFQAGAILIPGFWRMRDKIGMPLDEIHVSGNVPQFREKLKTSMERFFRRMPVDKPVIRNNYFVQVVRPQAQEKHEEDHDHDREHDPVAEEAETASDADPEELGWSASTNGDEDGFAHGHGHSAEAASYLAPATLRIRSERQTLRRLPRSGAVVFGIRTYLFKVEELARERGVPARLASAVRSWPDDVAVYKGRKMYKDVLLRYLDECAERDVAEGGNGVEDGKGYPF